VLKLAPCLDYKVVSERRQHRSERVIRRLNPLGAELPGWATTPMEYTRFVLEALSAWKELGLYRQFLLEPVVSILAAARGDDTGYTEFSWRKEPFIVTLYPDGRIGSSDHFPLPAALIGHVQDDATIDAMLQRAIQSALFSKLAALVDDCRSCSHRETCRGGSLADRLRYAGTDFATQYCESRIALIDGVCELAGSKHSRSKPL
jgi:uncharacterized protein